MKKNMGNLDKGIRILIAAIIAILAYTKVLDGTLAIVLLILAGVFVLTSIVGFCPLYAVLGIQTNKKK
ncbi:MAG: DUF2892 domain-containing protein [Bacteroidia bacterium]|nr:DUF2892 domain-containing protein [Bacteroidia bacterium]